MNRKIVGILLFLGSNSIAAMNAGKLMGIDNYQNPCWVNIVEAKNQKEPSLTDHKITIEFNYNFEILTLTHPMVQTNNVFQPATFYTGRLGKSGFSTVTFNIDKDYTPTSLVYWDNEGGPHEFKRRSFECKFSR